MKTIGSILTILSGIIIAINLLIVHSAKQDMMRNPGKYLFGGGPNAYTFVPPYSAFEILVMVAGIAGIVLLIISYQEKKN